MDRSSSECTRISTAVRHSVHRTWKQIEDVREQIEKANVSLNELRKVERELLDVASATAPLLSPFQRVPLDIIAEIAGNVIAIDNNFSSVSHGIWPLTHVCRTWRSAILSLPRLWSSFSVSDDPECPPQKLISTLLKRSKNHPLSFKLAIHGTDSEPVISLLVNCSKRWKDVKLDWRIGPAPLLRLYCNLPMLESLDLDLNISNGQDKWSNSPGGKKIFGVAPNLTKLALRCPLSEEFQFLLPMQQLREVSFHATAKGTPRSWIMDFSVFRDLSRLHIRRSDDLPLYGPRDGNKVILPLLKHLKLEGDLSLLSVLRVPLLETLTLEDFGGIAVSRMADFLNTIEIGHLVAFHFSGHPWQLRLDDSVLIEILSHHKLQSLRTLTIGRYPHAGPLDMVFLFYPPRYPFLKRLTYFPHSAAGAGDHLPMLLPRLRNFTYAFDPHLEPGDNNMFDVVREFIISRTRLVDVAALDPTAEDQPVPARLETVHVTYENSMPPITLDNFHRLEKGLVQLLEVSESASESED